MKPSGMMKKWAGIVMLAVGLCSMSVTGCSNGDDNNTSSGGDGQRYELYSRVTLDGQEYLVTKNTESDASNSRSARAIETSASEIDIGDGDVYYLNEKIAEYRDNLLREKDSETAKAYVELYALTKLNASAVNSVTTLDDTYLIIRGSKKYYTILIRWDREQLGMSREEFQESLEDLRKNYDPNLVTITREKAAYDDDLSRKIRHQYTYSYDADYRVSFTEDNVRQFLEYKDYVKINGVEKSVYRITEQKQSSQVGYHLNDPLTGGYYFFTFRIRDNGIVYYSLETRGEGDVGGLADVSFYSKWIMINQVEYESAGKPLLSYTVTTSGSSVVDDENKPYTDFSEYAVPSKENVRLAGVSFDVPSEITFCAPFADTSAKRNEFTSVTFVPQAKDGGVVYVPKAGSKTPYDFIDKFEDKFLETFSQN